MRILIITLFLSLFALNSAFSDSPPGLAKKGMTVAPFGNTPPGWNQGVKKGWNKNKSWHWNKKTHYWENKDWRWDGHTNVWIKR